jgi:mRNA-degrading endonuclease toxin of MazEF toxin-antitoxin module
MPRVVRGGIYEYQSIRRVQVLVISVNMLNEIGTLVVVEITDKEPQDDPRVLVAVPLGPQDPVAGTVLCWRLSYANADRLDATSSLGQVSSATLDRVVSGVRALIEP